MNQPMVLEQLKPFIVQNNVTSKITKNAYRFDIFKGIQESDGSVTKVGSVGSAYVREGHQTYVVVLKTFLKDRFYLLPNTKANAPMDYVILTREIGRNIERKYFWNVVGQGHILDEKNSGLMKLTWDVLAGDIFMNLHPVRVRSPMEVTVEAAA